MTRAIAASPATELWRIGALQDLPRDMHCAHEQPAGDPLGGIAACPECRRVREVMEALRGERPS